jgi:hypothetical protein
MKKWLSIILVVICAFAASFYAYQKLTERKIASLEDIVPDNAIYYLYSYNLDKNSKELQSGAFFKELSASPFFKKSISPKLEKAKQKFPFLSDFIRKDVAVAVFSLGNVNSPNQEVADFGDFFFLSRVDPKVLPAVRKSLADFYISLTQGNRKTHKIYNGVNITTYSLKSSGLQVHCAILSDVVVVTNKTDLIHKSIDLYKGKSFDSLANSKLFRKLTARIQKNSLFWGFYNTKLYYQELLRSYANDSLKSKDANGSSSVASLMKIQSFVNVMNIMEGCVFYASYDDIKSGITLTAINTYNIEADKDNIIPIFASGRKIDAAVVNLVPADITAFCASNQDFPGLWSFAIRLFSSMEEMWIAKMKNDPRYARFNDQVNNFRFESIIAKAESYLGINLEKEVLPLLGNNFGIILVRLDDINISFPRAPKQGTIIPDQQRASFILPQVYCFLELKDAQGMKNQVGKAMNNFLEKTNNFFREQERKTIEAYKQKGVELPEQINEATLDQKKYLDLKIQDYKGTDIYILEVLSFSLDMIKLNYAFLDKYIIISCSPALTKKVLDVYNNRQQGLNKEWIFEKAKSNMLPDYSTMMFFDTGKLIDNIRGSKTYQDYKPLAQESKNSNFTKENFDSVLSLLRNIEAIVFSVKMLDPGTIESSYYIKVNGL